MLSDSDLSRSASPARLTHKQELATHFDKRINEEYEEIRRIREERNDRCSATSSLPPEILLTIFELLAQPHSFCSSKTCSDPLLLPRAVRYGGPTYGNPAPVSPGCFDAFYGRLKWSRAARVCRKWRTVALNSPSLWTRLRRLSSQSMQGILTRYPDAPLDIHCSVERLKDIVEVSGGDSLALFQRIRRLTLLVNYFTLDKSVFSHPLPVLESLRLAGGSEFPNSFFDVHIPTLKSISLRLPQVPLDGHLFSNLQQLTLVNEWAAILKNEDSRLAVDDFLSLLQRQPQLQALAFTFPTNTADYSTPLKSRVVELSRLKELSITSLQYCQGPWFQILEHFSCPRLESLSASLITKPHFGTSSYDQLMPLKVIRTFFIEHGKYLANQRLVIGQDTIQLYDNINSLRDQIPHLNIKVTNIRSDIKFPVSFEWETFLEFISDENITVTCLECIHLDRQMPITICDSVQVLRLVGDTSLPYFLRALVDYGSFDSLECIRFEEVSFAPRAKTIPAIKRWYSARCAAGGREVTFRFHRCGISESNVKALERSKCKVLWDGVDRTS